MGRNHHREEPANVLTQVVSTKHFMAKSNVLATSPVASLPKSRPTPLTVATFSCSAFLLEERKQTDGDVVLVRAGSVNVAALPSECHLKQKCGLLMFPWRQLPLSPGVSVVTPGVAGAAHHL